MQKKTKAWDLVWGAVFASVIALLIIPSSRGGYMTLTGSHPYLCGFISFAVLATMGDLLACRISTNFWKWNRATFVKMLIWGIIGMGITLFFSLFGEGVASLQKIGMLPFPRSNLSHAFFSSLLMNITFGPAMFTFHKFTDTYIEAKYYHKPSGIDNLIEAIDWKTFYKFTIFTTQPCIWIPCHTVVFLLPPKIRILVAALLSIALGLVLSIKNRVKKNPQLGANGERSSENIKISNSI